MSDPRKNFICKARKHIINDTIRNYGRDSECFFCIMELRKTFSPIENNVDFYEPTELKMNYCESTNLNIGDLVKYYFGSHWLIPQIGIITEIWESCIHPGRLRYGAKRVDCDFVDGGYREEFIKIEK